MIRRHAGRALTDLQRKRWMDLLLECADEIGVPSDPEFRSALVSLSGMGTRLADDQAPARRGASVRSHPCPVGAGAK